MKLSKESMETSVHLGSRIACDGEYATVKYIGEIESQEGLWIGVEWDSPSRGKHSGSYKNTVYFETSIPNAGSFIRPSKIETGISCPEAIRKKYGKETAEAGDATSLFSLPQKSGKLRVVEMVGFSKVAGKQSQFNQLNEVILAKMVINEPGAAGEMEDLVPNTTNLDLSYNLLSSWNDVAAIVGQLPKLESVILSKNDLKVEDCMDRYKEPFAGVATLVLNYMNYTWGEVMSCGAAWPYVENLYLCHNGIQSLEMPLEPLFSKLRFLSLEGNPVSSWDEVNKLGGLSSLEELIVDNTELESISFAGIPPMEKTPLFPNLLILSLRNNRLSRWQDISELSKLQNLKELNVTNNPVIHSVSPETARQLVIAKLSGLQRLNRTEVDKSERRGAEIDYIKRFHTDWIAQGGHRDAEKNKPSAEFLAEHPTYKSVSQKHGGAEESEVIPQKSLLKNTLISLEIFSSQMPNKPPLTRRLPATMTVCKVKGLIRRMFNVPVQNIRMTCLHAQHDGIGTEMDNDLREIAFYSVSDGDKIEVNW